MADTNTWTPISAPTDFQDDAVFNIDFKTKTVQVLVEQPIVAGENLSQFIKFQAPRFYDNIDLTEMSVNILFISPAGNTGISAAVNTEYSDDMIRCGWLVPYAACPVKGTLLFVLEFVGADYTLKTTIASTPVLDSISDTDVVPEPVEQAWYITLQANVSAALQEAQTALGRIESIFNALSAPMSAGTAVDMADESAIYVYTGSETGYTYGNWYYYDGTEWVSGGIYASTALVTDPTLSQSGQAADAKETGDGIDRVDSSLRDTNADVYEASALHVNATVNEWKLNASNGLSVADSNYKIVKYMVTAGDRIKVIANDKFQFQTVASVPSYGDSNRVGKTYSAGTYYLTVPETATYLIMSALASGGIAEAYSLATKTDGLAEQIENTDIEVANIKDTLQVEKIESVNKIDPSALTDGRYIYNGTYEDNASYKTTDYISVNTGDVISFYRKTSVVPNIERTTGERLALFDASKNYLGVSIQYPIKIDTRYTVENASAKYIKLSYPASLGDVELTVNQIVDEFSEYFTPHFESLRLKQIEQGTDIITLNKTTKSLLLQSKRPKNVRLDAYLREPKPLALLHFSDIHGDSVELERMVEFAESNSDLIDDSICTGDLVVSRWSSDFSYWSNTAGAEKILIAVGNHDVLTDEVGQDWTQRATQADQYTRYFAPFIENWNCSYESGKTYYYKDYDDSKIRLIVLNCMLTGADDTAQLAWFVSALTGAKTAGYSVVVANHYMVFSPVKVSCNFSTLDKSVEGADVLPSAYLAEVQNHIDDGGKFICHIAGHTHWDVVVKSQNYPNQICIVVDALNRTQSNQYSDTQRTNGDKSQDLANVVVFDTSSGVVKVIRIGASADHYLRQKNCLTIDYLTGNIIAES